MDLVLDFLFLALVCTFALWIVLTLLNPMPDYDAALVKLSVYLWTDFCVPTLLVYLPALNHLHSCFRASWHIMHYNNIHMSL